MAGNVGTESAVKVRPQPGRGALLDRVAAGALGEGLFTLGDIGLGQIGLERRGILAAFAFLDDTGDLETHGFGPLFLAGMEITRADRRKAQQDNAGKQGPPGNGIETV